MITHYANIHIIQMSRRSDLNMVWRWIVENFNLKELENLVQGSFLNYLWWLFEIWCAIYKNLYVGYCLKIKSLGRKKTPEI